MGDTPSKTRFIRRRVWDWPAATDGSPMVALGGLDMPDLDNNPIDTVQPLRKTYPRRLKLKDDLSVACDITPSPE